MRTGLVLSIGIAGALFMLSAIIMSIVLIARKQWGNSQTKATLRFFITQYSITAIACLIGAGLGYLELCPVPVLWVLNSILALTGLSAIYANKSKRFRTTV
jgi:hypothetical protein